MKGERLGERVATLEQSVINFHEMMSRIDRAVSTDQTTVLQEVKRINGQIFLLNEFKNRAQGAIAVLGVMLTVFGGVLLAFGLAMF